MDVAKDIGVVRFISDEAIKVLPLPERAGAAEMLVGGPCGSAFPRLYHLCQTAVFPGFNEHVDVIWHHTPGEKLVVLAVEVEKSFLDERTDFWITQPTRPMSSVEVFFAP
jgi:hypothetical protein